MRSTPHLHRRRALCCGAAAVAGLFTALLPRADAAYLSNPCRRPLPAELAGTIASCFEGLDAHALWDVHTHLLGTGDSGSGCRIHASMTEGFHPVERLRRAAILNAACVPATALASGGVDEAYVAGLRELAADFPAGARWLLYAFDEARDDAGRARADWTTFHVPDRYACEVARSAPERFGWVASIHPLHPQALPRLEQAIADGALAIKWLPSAMAIDLLDPRLAPFYARLAAARLPLIVHCGEEKAVPGAGRDELGNPLRVRAPLQAGVRVIVAHCASLGSALDLDRRRPEVRPAFELFARLMDEPAWQHLLLGDVSALFQANRPPEVWRTVLQRSDWHPRLLHGSDYPLPGVGPLYSLHTLIRHGLLTPDAAAPLERLREHNPLLFDLALRRRVAWRGHSLSACVFDTRRHFVGPQSLA